MRLAAELPVFGDGEVQRILIGRRRHEVQLRAGRSPALWYGVTVQAYEDVCVYAVRDLGPFPELEVPVVRPRRPDVQPQIPQTGCEFESGFERNVLFSKAISQRARIVASMSRIHDDEISASREGRTRRSLGRGARGTGRFYGSEIF